MLSQGGLKQKAKYTIHFNMLILNINNDESVSLNEIIFTKHIHFVSMSTHNLSPTWH